MPVSDLTFDDFVPDFADQLASEPGGEGLYSCLACGTCSASCPVRRINSRYNPRKIIHMILLGMKAQVIKSGYIWLCSNCYTCEERCPQGIKVSDLMTAVRNMAVREGHVPPGATTQAKLIRTQGRLYTLDEFDEKKRKKAGLPSLVSKVEEVVHLLESE